jgi:hypothetical protein
MPGRKTHILGANKASTQLLTGLQVHCKGERIEAFPESAKRLEIRKLNGDWDSLGGRYQ